MSAGLAKIRVAIVDDESHARLRLRQLLADNPDFEIVAECANGVQAVDCVRGHKPDVIFLDIQMPRMSGLQVCETLAADGVPLPIIIFVTAYNEYALKAFEVHALDYLLKPFDRERFNKCLLHLSKQVRARTEADTSAKPDSQLLAFIEELRQRSKAPERLVFKQSGRILFIKVETIDWVESDGNYVKVHVGAETHHLRETLGDIESQLPETHFMRISRSAIVNLNRIKELQPLFYGDYVVILHNGSKLNLSRSYRDRLESLLGDRA